MADPKQAPLSKWQGSPFLDGSGPEAQTAPLQLVARHGAAHRLLNKHRRVVPGLGGSMQPFLLDAKKATRSHVSNNM